MFFPPDDFHWDDYLKETESLRAPSECFRQVCQNSIDVVYISVNYYLVEGCLCDH